MALAERVKSDLVAAMKAGERERVGALRFVLAELQKAAKEGSSDETAVLRRERKRRLDAAEQFDAGGRADLASKERHEAELIEGYLPAELSDQELAEIVAAALRDTGAETPRDMGRVMPVAMASVAGRADGKRVSAKVREALGA